MFAKTCERKCIICGKTFYAVSSRMNACSDACRKIRERDRRQRKQQMKKPVNDLSKMERKAREHDMSYGQYMTALMTGRLTK